MNDPIRGFVRRCARRAVGCPLARQLHRPNSDGKPSGGPGYSAAMTDHELSEKSHLSFLAMGREARAKALERMTATLRSQASLLYKMSREVPERI